MAARESKSFRFWAVTHTHTKLWMRPDQSAKHNLPQNLLKLGRKKKENNLLYLALVVLHLSQNCELWISPEQSPLTQFLTTSNTTGTRQLSPPCLLNLYVFTEKSWNSTGVWFCIRKIQDRNIIIILRKIIQELPRRYFIYNPTWFPTERKLSSFKKETPGRVTINWTGENEALKIKL